MVRPRPAIKVFTRRGRRLASRTSPTPAAPATVSAPSPSPARPPSPSATRPTTAAPRPAAHRPRSTISPSLRLWRPISRCRAGSLAGSGARRALLLELLFLGRLVVVGGFRWLVDGSSRPGGMRRRRRSRGGCSALGPICGPGRRRCRHRRGDRDLLVHC